MFKPTFDVQLYNVSLLGIGFLLLSASFSILSSTMTVMVQSINEELDVHWNASTALSIIFVVNSFTVFTVPSILTMISPKNCLSLFSFLAGAGFLAFLYPVRYVLNIVSIILGFCLTTLYVTQSKLLIQLSNSDTLNRNTGLYWAIHQFGLVFGSLYFYLRFAGVEQIKRIDRTQTYAVFIGSIFLAAFIFLLIKNAASDVGTDKSSAFVAFKRCFSILASRKMLLLLVPFLYTGLQQSFLMILYPNAVANTKWFGADSVKLIGVLNVFRGLGEIAGGGLFALFSRFIKNNRKKLFIFAFALNLITFLLIFLNHPNDSTIQPTESSGIIEPRVWISMVCGVLFGLTDSYFNSQLVALVGTIYSDSVDLSSAYALFSFLHSIGQAFLFFYSNSGLTLYVHLVIVLIFSILNVVLFCSVNLPQPKQLDLI